MKLAEYLKTKNETARSFAARVKLSEPTISRLLNGVHRPDWSTVTRIYEATAGAVTANDWMPLPVAKPRRKRRA